MAELRDINMPITINDCIRCGKPPKFETERPDEHTFEFTWYFWKCWKCERESEWCEIFDESFRRWNELNPRSGDADNNQ